MPRPHYPQLGLGLQSPTSPRPTYSNDEIMRVGQKLLLQQLFPSQLTNSCPTDTVSDFGSLRSLLHAKTPPISSPLLCFPRKYPIPAQAAKICTPIVGKHQPLSTLIPFHAIPKNCPLVPLILWTLRVRSSESTMERRVKALRRTLRRSKGAGEVGSHT